MLYAAYGSHLHPARLRARVPSAVLLGTAAVDGWSLRFHKRGRDGSAKCNIVRAADEIHVAVYRIEPTRRAVLDEIEGVGVGYRTQPLEVSGFGSCATYVAVRTHVDDTLRSFSWYRDLVVLGCDHFYFPRPYRDRIASVAVVDDPDRARHDEHVRIVREARGTPASGAR